MALIEKLLNKLNNKTIALDSEMAKLSIQPLENKEKLNTLMKQRRLLVKQREILEKQWFEF